MAYDLVAVIDHIGIGARAARDIDLGEYPIVENKAMLCACCIPEQARDLTAIVDAEGCGPRGSREIDRSKHILIH